MIRVYFSYQNEESVREIDAEEAFVGRPKEGVRIDLDLTPDMAVSRPHARVYWHEGRLCIEDLESRFGTRLNNMALHGAEILQADSEVVIGSTLLRFEWVDQPNPDEGGRPRDAQKTSGDDPGVDASAAHDSGGSLEIRRVLDARANFRDFIPDDPALAYSKRRLALIYDLPLQLAAETRWESLLQSIVEKLVEVIPDASHCTLLLEDRNGHLEAGASFPSSSLGVSTTLARRAMDDRNGFIWRRSDEGDISQSVVLYGIQTGMYAPLLWQGRALGAVCVDNPRRSSLFSDDDLRLLLMIAQYAAMAVANQQLQRDLHDAWTGSLDALTAALASRDNDTQSHCFRTVELAVVIAREMGLGEEEIPSIARGALLHDIGKIGISDTILFKPAALSETERDMMRRHVSLGNDMLKHIAFFSDALAIVLYHHEDYDGSGYPEGRAGEDIPLAARIFHVVDTYDALTHQRPYKTAWAHEEAMAELRAYSGTRYDPQVVAVLDSLSPETTECIRTLTAFSPETRAILGRGIR